jgi:dihydroneopterin triphosphate diphosphatase
VTDVKVGTVDVYVVNDAGPTWRVLALQRARSGTRCPNAWETVHGTLEAGESPEEGALRELREETGLEPTRFYSVTVQPYYLFRMRTVQLAVVFCAFVDSDAVVLGPEHQRHEWLSPEAAARRFVWPRERDALREIEIVLAGGDAGPVEDVLRVK